MVITEEKGAKKTSADDIQQRRLKHSHGICGIASDADNTL